MPGGRIPSARPSASAPAALLFSGSRFSSLIFATHGITPLGYAAFAFTLGIAAGALIRRTVPAMAVTLAIFAAVQIAMPLWVRPHLLPPDHTVIPVTSLESTSSPQSTGTSAAFDLLTQHRPRPARRLDPLQRSRQRRRAAGQHCPGRLPRHRLGTSSAFVGCLESHGIREAITYQPASRYWPLQWIETAIYLALALALAGYCFRRLNRRRS